jgi:hypothetical protein
MFYKYLSFLFVVIMSLAVTVCASYQAGGIDVRAVDQYSLRTIVDGISLAADLYDSTEKTKQGFYVDVNSEGFYPVNLIFKNNTDDRVLVFRETMELIDSSGNIYRPVSSTAMFNTFEHNKIAYALLGFGIFSYMSAEEANRKMETDWHQKEIPDQLLILPSRKANGFVYFQLPKEKTIKGGKLRLEAEKLETKTKSQLELTL